VFSRPVSGSWLLVMVWFSFATANLAFVLLFVVGNLMGKMETYYRIKKIQQKDKRSFWDTERPKLWKELTRLQERVILIENKLRIERKSQ
jgi:hypothetical protein